MTVFSLAYIWKMHSVIWYSSPLNLGYKALIQFHLSVNGVKPFKGLVVRTLDIHASFWMHVWRDWTYHFEFSHLSFESYSGFKLPSHYSSPTSDVLYKPVRLPPAILFHITTHAKASRFYLCGIPEKRALRSSASRWLCGPHCHVAMGNLTPESHPERLFPKATQEQAVLYQMSWKQRLKQTFGFLCGVWWIKPQEKKSWARTWFQAELDLGVIHRMLSSKAPTSDLSFLRDEMSICSKRVRLWTHL